MYAVRPSILIWNRLIFHEQWRTIRKHQSVSCSKVSVVLLIRCVLARWGLVVQCGPNFLSSLLVSHTRSTWSSCILSGAVHFPSLTIVVHTSARLWQDQVCQCSSAFLEPHARIWQPCALPTSSSTMCSQSLSRPFSPLFSQDLPDRSVPNVRSRTRSLSSSFCCPSRLFGTHADLAPRSVQTVCHLVFRPLLLCRLVPFFSGGFGYFRSFRVWVFWCLGSVALVVQVSGLRVLWFMALGFPFGCTNKTQNETRFSLFFDLPPKGLKRWINWNVENEQNVTKRSRALSTKRLGKHDQNVTKGFDFDILSTWKMMLDKNEATCKKKWVQAAFDEITETNHNWYWAWLDKNR